MSDAVPTRSEIAEEQTTARLLALVGPRHDVPADSAARAKAAVHRQWQIDRRQRSFRRRTIAGMMVLATAAGLMLMMAPFNTDPVRTAGEQVAEVDQMVGKPRRESAESAIDAAGFLSPRDPIRTGEWITTDSETRVALRFAGGTSVRLDVSSRIQALSRQTIELAAGAVYVDTDGESGTFQIRTPIATARDVGTQFELRLLPARTLRLRVRSGVVELFDATRLVSGHSGTEVIYSRGGPVSQPIAVHGPLWDWTASVAPGISIEGMTLGAVVQRIARERGWSHHYSDATLEREAATTVLHGSVDGLSLSEALEVAVTTSGLRFRIEDGQLIVFRPAEPGGR